MTTNDLVMQLLAERIPVTLLLDLLDVPDPAELYAVEGGSAAWLPARHAGAA